MQAIGRLAPQARTLVIRDALLQANGAQMVAKGLDSIPVLMGNNIAVSDTKIADVIEWSSHTGFIARLLKKSQSFRVSCTNHHPSGLSPTFPDSSKRLNTLDQNAGAQDIQDLQAALHAVSRPTTIHSVIAEPAGKSMLMALQTRPNKSATKETWTIIDWETVGQSSACI